MFLQNQIKNIEKFVVYNNFDTLFQICKQIRGCHYYYISKEDEVIYACNEMAYALHALDIPSNLNNNISIPKSLLFVLAAVDEQIAMQYSTFMQYMDFPWILLPTETRHEHMEYTIEWDFVNDTPIVTKNGNPVDYIRLDNPSISTFTSKKLLDIIDGYRYSRMWLGEAQFFGDQEKNPVIRTVMDNKASAIGNKYLRLESINGKHYGMMVFKNLFNLNKADNLVICIRDRLDIPSIFQAEFITTKKKSPIPNLVPFFKETTYATFLNL